MISTIKHVAQVPSVIGLIIHTLIKYNKRVLHEAFYCDIFTDFINL